MWKPWMIYLVAFAASLKLIFGKTDRAIGYAVFYSLLFFLLLCFLSVLLARRCLRLEQRPTGGYAGKNEPLAYSFTLKARGPFFYPRVQVSLTGLGGSAGTAGTRIFALGPKGVFSHTQEIRFPYRGVYPLGVKRIEVSDLLGLFLWKLPVPSPAPVTVLPLADDAHRAELQEDAQQLLLQKQSFFEDYSAVTDIRQYGYADSLRKIHWPLSAARGELIVKSYRSFEQERVLLFLDTRPVPVGKDRRAAFEDKVISYVAAAVSACTTAGMSGELLCGGSDEGAPLRGEAGERALYELLAGVRFGDPEAPLPALHERAGTTRALCYLSRLTPEDHAVLLHLCALDCKLSICYFSPAGEALPEGVSARLTDLRLQGVQVSEVEVLPPEAAAESEAAG